MTDKNYYELRCEAGSVHLSVDAIADLAANIARETEGVADLAATTSGHTKGVLAQVGEQGCVLEVHIITVQGLNMSSVAKNVQVKVKELLDSIAKVQIQEVNVFVDGVHAK